MSPRHPSSPRTPPPTTDDLTLLSTLPQPEARWFVRPDGRDGAGTIHGLAHTRRVLVHAVELAVAMGVPEGIRQAVVLAALWHDIGRTDDRLDPLHGAKSAGKVVGLGLHVGLDPRAVELALFAVAHHSGPDEDGHRAARDLPDPTGATSVLSVLKDADALDRVRFGGLDVRFLRFPEARLRVLAAEALLEAIPG